MSASRALLLAQWAWREGSISRLWKAVHTAPVASMAFDPVSTLLATGRGPLAGWVCWLESTAAGDFWHSSPFPSNTSPQVAVTGLCASGTLCGITGHTTFGARRVLYSECQWRAGGQGNTTRVAQLTCPTPPACSLVAFHPDPARLLLFSSSIDATIRVWSLQDRSCLAVLTAHYSTVTSLTFTGGGQTMLRLAAGRPALAGVEGAAAETWKLTWLFSPSSGRDKICVVWDLRTHQATRTVPVFEVGVARDRGQ